MNNLDCSPFQAVQIPHHLVTGTRVCGLDRDAVTERHMGQKEFYHLPPKSVTLDRS
jgi:hypothetical protein